MLAQSSQAPPPPSADVSDGGSSSLSELGDMPDEQQEYDTIGQGSEDDDIRDNDTEASTERIDPSPQKPLTAPIHQPSSLDLLGDAAAVEQLQEANAADDDPMYSLSDLRKDTIVLSQPATKTEEHLGSPRKRKRSSSLSDLEDDIEDTAPPPRKRSASARGDTSLDEVGQHLGNLPEHTTDGEQTRPEIEPMSGSESEHDAPSPTAPQEASIAGANDLQADDEGAVSDITPPPDESTLPHEGADQPQPTEPAPDDDPATRDQDEQQRKNAALSDLKPIENLFAIFRDKFFDERLAALSAEIASLRQAPHLITHPEFLNKRVCIDARRDAKAAQADTEFRYKAGTLERKALAERAITHGQYFQEVRELRESHLEKVNTHFSALSRERKAHKAKDPHYLYRFDSKRANQIRNQQRYNKEVSILAGIARYEGFPAAPELGPAPPADVQDDLQQIRAAAEQTMMDRSNTQGGLGLGHHMAMTPLAGLSTPGALLNGTPAFNVTPLLNGIHGQRSQPMSVPAQIASEEMAGEATFLERNPWARQIPMASLGRVPAQLWHTDAGTRHSPIDVDDETGEHEDDVGEDFAAGLGAGGGKRKREEGPARVNGLPTSEVVKINGTGVKYGPVERPTQSPELVKKEADSSRSPFAGPGFGRDGFVRSVGVSS